MKKSNRGFTLVELMVTIALGAILLGLAIPGLGGWIRESRLTKGANDLILSATLARTEALKRRVPVGVCIAVLDDIEDGGGAACRARSGPAVGDVWMVFVDEDLDLVADSDADIIRVLDTPPAAVRTSLLPVPAATDQTYMMYGLDGFRTVLPAPGTISLAAVILCDRRGNVEGVGGNSTARAILLPPTGRAAVSRAVSEITALLEDLPEGESCSP